MIEFVKDKNGDPLDIRSLTGRLPFFAVTQGAASDGKNIYMIFERKHKKKRTHRCKIVKLDAASMKIVKISGELRIGHGNDLAFYRGVLYVTHSRSGRILHRVDAETLKQLPDVKVLIPAPAKLPAGSKILLSHAMKKHNIKAFNGIACDGAGNGTPRFTLRVMQSPGMLVAEPRENGDLTVVRYYRTERFYRTSQSMDQKDGLTYRVYSHGQSRRRNFLVVFDGDGKMLRRTLLPVTGEVESVFFVGDRLYGSVYRRTKDRDGVHHFAAYLFRIELPD